MNFSKTDLDLDDDEDDFNYKYDVGNNYDDVFNKVSAQFALISFDEEKTDGLENINHDVSEDYLRNSGTIMYPKSLVVLDLDQTLVFTDVDNTMIGSDYMIDIQGRFVNGRIRPYTRQFLLELCELTNVAIWSAGSHDYVNDILNIIIPWDYTLEFVYSLNKCVSYRDESNQCVYLTKPLQRIWDLEQFKVKGINERTTLIVDDTPSTYSQNPGNAVEIARYYGNDNDQELLRVLYDIRMRLSNSDVRVGVV